MYEQPMVGSLERLPFSHIKCIRTYLALNSEKLNPNTVPLEEHVWGYDFCCERALHSNGISKPLIQCEFANLKGQEIVGCRLQKMASLSSWKELIWILDSFCMSLENTGYNTCCKKVRVSRVGLFELLDKVSGDPAWTQIGHPTIPAIKQGTLSHAPRELLYAIYKILDWLNILYIT